MGSEEGFRYCCLLWSSGHFVCVVCVRVLLMGRESLACLSSQVWRFLFSIPKERNLFLFRGKGTLPHIRHCNASSLGCMYCSHISMNANLATKSLAIITTTLTLRYSRGTARGRSANRNLPTALSCFPYPSPVRFFSVLAMFLFFFLDRFGCLESQLKVGTNHLLGMSIVLPSTTGKRPAGRIPRVRPRRASDDATPRSPIVPPPPPPLSPPFLRDGPAVGRDIAVGSGGEVDGAAGGRGGGDRARPAADHPVQPLQPLRQQQQQQQDTDPVDREPAGRSSGKKRPRSELGGGAGDGAGTWRAAGRPTGPRPSFGDGLDEAAAVQRTASRGGDQALDGSGGRYSDREAQGENQGGAGREPKRRRAGWRLGLGFLRLWGRRASALDVDGDAAAATAAGSSPAGASGNQPQPGGGGQEPARPSRGGGPVKGSDGGHHQPGPGQCAAAAAASYRAGDCSPSSTPGPGGPGSASGRVEATEGSPSSFSCGGNGGDLGGNGGYGGEAPVVPLRRSPLTITVVLAPPPASHSLGNERRVN